MNIINGYINIKTMRYFVISVGDKISFFTQWWSINFNIIYEPHKKAPSKYMVRA